MRLEPIALATSGGWLLPICRNACHFVTWNRNQSGKNGQPLQRRNALRAWQEATTEVLGEALRLHDLRTTLASRLVASGVDVPTAQALLRHARPSTTLDVYTRVQGDAAARLERMRAAIDV
ncbi:MAG TPA: tyrosine-type recombinase/integrase [Gaiellaceae bacterium]|nr:tyrosine-type recombinase/integrase [Gaiellaceae bacterium]